VILATSLVHLYPPKHHGRALQTIDQVLEVDGDNVACLMGRAYILQYSKNWNEAGELFARVAERMSEDVNLGLRAREEHAWCVGKAGSPADAIQNLKGVAGTLEGLDDRDIDKARCFWRIGACFWEMGGKCPKLPKALRICSVGCR
jgi:superkiller protein 3